MSLTSAPADQCTTGGVKEWVMSDEEHNITYFSSLTWSDFVCVPHYVFLPPCSHWPGCWWSTLCLLAWYSWLSEFHIIGFLHCALIGGMLIIPGIDGSHYMFLPYCLISWIAEVHGRCCLFLLIVLNGVGPHWTCLSCLVSGPLHVFMLPCFDWLDVGSPHYCMCLDHCVMSFSDLSSSFL